MTETNWMPWTGTECPVELDACVEVMLDDGEISRYTAGGYDWAMTTPNCTIIAYRVLERGQSLADELQQRIPWSALADWVQYVAMDKDCRWFAYSEKPYIQGESWNGGNYARSLNDAIMMPYVPADRWHETLVARPTEE